MLFITAEKGEVARAKGERETEKECTTERKSRRRRDEKAPWALSGREEVLRKGGGEEARSVRCMCDVCAAHATFPSRLTLMLAMTTTYLVHDEEERVREVYVARAGAERRRIRVFKLPES